MQVHKGRPPTAAPDELAAEAPRPSDRAPEPAPDRDVAPQAPRPRARRGAKAAPVRPREQATAHAGHAAGTGAAGSAS
jgi:hypothetical protein